jgi:dienelactone hydrolase
MARHYSRTFKPRHLFESGKLVLLTALLCGPGCTGFPWDGPLPIPVVDGGPASVAAVDGGVEQDSGFGDGGAGGDPAPIDAACDWNGCLREMSRLETYAQADIEPYLDDGVTIDNGYTIYRIRFFTNGQEATATVTVPNLMNAPERGYPIGINNPGTVGVADACTPGFSLLGVGLAGYFGARGYVGLSLDYPGLGTAGSHPYLVRVVEGRATLDAARATLQLAALEGIPISGRIAVTGLSQGGHATIGAAMEHATYGAELDVRLFAAAAPASVFFEHWSAGVSLAGPHMVYHALIVYAYQLYYGHSGPAVFHPEMADQMDTIMDTHCLFSEDGPTLFDAVPENPNDLFSTLFLSAYQQGELDAFPIIEEGFAKNRLAPYVQTAPLWIYQGTHDDVVPKYATDELVDALRTGGVEVDYEIVAAGGHADVAFSYLSQNQMRTESFFERLDAIMK